LSIEPAATQAAKSVTACEAPLADGPPGGMSPPSHVHRLRSFPIQLKQLLGLLHWLW
jgi:hypothetical protein